MTDAAQARAVWAAGDFPKVAANSIPHVGPGLVAAAGIRTGDRVLDVAAGSGATSIPAARAGGDVHALDITPELLAAGRSAAVASGVAIEWIEGDAEALPFADASFDVVLSSFGVMFAPRHEVAAAELTRVCRPGGTIGLATWTPGGWVGGFFALMARFSPPPPPGAASPGLWGVEEHVRGLLGAGVSSMTFTVREQPLEIFATPEELVAFYKENFGPLVLLYASLDDTTELDAAFDDYVRSTNRAGTGERARWTLEYAEIVARRAG